MVRQLAHQWKSAIERRNVREQEVNSNKIPFGTNKTEMVVKGVALKA